MQLKNASFCPYVGLRPYEEEHHDYFFGRTGDIRVIYSTVLAVSLSVLYGASGVGKSSVLLAGVIPELRLRHRTAIVVFRDWQRPDALAELKARCIAAASIAHGSQIGVDASLPLDELLAATRKAFGGTFVILLDQFEEYFLYHPESEGGNGFDAEFARSVNRTDVDAGFLLSMREDGLSKLDRFKVRIPNMLSNAIRLSHLDEKSAEEAIVKPLRMFNDQFHPETAYSIEVDLVKVILRQVTSVSPTGAVGTQIETPLLQLVMERMWLTKEVSESHELTLQTFNDRLGDVPSLLQTHLTRVMSRLDAVQQALCAHFFDRLVTPSGSKLACRLDDLIEYANADEQAVRSVAEKLDQNRILRRIDPPPGQTVPSYEIFHDVLAPAVLTWRQQYLAAEGESRARAQATAEADERARETIRQREMDSARTLVREQQLRATAEQQRADAERLRADNEARGARRFRTLSWSLAAMTVVASIATVIAVRHSNLAEENRREAIKNGQEAASQRDLAFAGELVGHARSNLGADPELSLILATYATSVIHPAPPEVISALNESVFAARIRKTLQLESPNIQVLGMASSPDGKYLAIVSDDGVVNILDAATLESRGKIEGQRPNSSAIAFSKDSAFIGTVSSDNKIKIWPRESWNLGSKESRESDKEIDGATDTVTQLKFSPTADVVASASLDGSVALWSADFGKPAHFGKPLFSPVHHSMNTGIQALAFSLDGTRLASGSADGTIKVWDTRGLRYITTLKGHKEGVESIAFSSDGRSLVSGGDRKVIIWDTRSWKTKIDLGAQHDTVFAVRFGASDRFIATGVSDGSAKIWDARSGKELFGLNGHTNAIQALEFSQRGDRLVTASWDGTVRIWDVSAVHLETIVDLAFSPDDKFIATASRDKTAMIWDAANGEVVRTLTGHSDSLSHIQFSPDSRKLVTGDEGGVAIVWDLTTGKSRRLKHRDAVTDTRFSPKGTFVATSSRDGKVRGWTASNLEPMPVLDGGQILNGLAFSADEKQLAAAGDEGEVIVWDLESGDRRYNSNSQELTHKEGTRVLAVAYSPNGKFLASCGTDNTVRIWDAVTGDLLNTLVGHKQQVLDVVFSADSTRLASASLDATAMLWDVNTGIGRPLIGHRQAVVHVRFSRDGSKLATASWDRTAKVWDVESAKELASLSHAGPVEAAEFSSDGNRLATAGGDRALRLNFWRDTDSLLKLARDRTTRPLTPNECARFLHGASCTAPR